MKINEILKSTFHYDSLRPSQVEPINLLCDIAPPDMFCIFPTSAGKSLLYQLPAIYKQMITIIISPLLSLMQDQISRLRSLNLGAYSYSSDDSTNSKLDLSTIAFTQPQDIQYIYTTPESLQNDSFKRIVRQL